MNCFVTTDDLTMLIKKARSLYKAAEAAQRLSIDLDEIKSNIKAADEIIDRSQKRLRKSNITKRQLGKVARTIEYHQELLACIETECEQKVPKFSEAMVWIEATVRDLAGIHANLAKVPRFEHGERSSSPE